MASATDRLSSSAIVVVSGILLFYLIVSYCLSYRKCSQFPGAFLASFSEAWLFIHTFNGQLYLDYAAAIDKYGSPVRIGSNKIVVNDPVILRHMSAPRSTFRRGTFYDAFALQAPTMNVLSQKDEKIHNNLRAKMIQGHYSSKDIPFLESDIDARILDLTSLIRSEMAQNKHIDLTSVAQYFTLDVLTHITFGAPFGYLTQNKDIYEYIKTVSESLQVLELGAKCSSVQSFISSALMKPMQPKATEKTDIGAMMGVAERIVSERFQPGAKPVPNMMGSFAKHGLTQEECEREAMVQVLSGSDSTATAIRMIILHIITNPTVYIKVMKELELNSRVIACPVLTSAESRKLPYMQACIKEGLRVFPSLQALNSKLSPRGDETVNDHFIPEGIEVAFSSYTMQRRKDVYGEESQYFKPERWIEAAAYDDGGERLMAMESTLDLIFGSRRFGCLGKNIAFIELDKVIRTYVEGV